MPVRELWPERSLQLLAVLPTYVHSANHATRATIEAIESDASLSERLFRPGIRQCIDLNYATASHQTIWEYAPRSRAAEDYTRFVDYVETPNAAIGEYDAELERDDAPAGGRLHTTAARSFQAVANGKAGD